MADAVIFRSELLEAASKSPEFSAPLLHRLARMEGERGASLRTQLERAAALVPVRQRPKVLGPLRALGAPDDQVRAAMGSLLLAKTLIDHGWSVEFEPEVGGGTPDFRITKGGSSFVVEVRRVAGLDRHPADDDVAKLRDALNGMQTRTPISIRSASVAGGASLKPFVRYLTTFLTGEPPPGDHVFHEDGIFVAFRVYKCFKEPLAVVLSWSGGVTHGGQLDDVRAHINEKLVKYKIPLIVALDFVDFIDPYTTVEEVLLGREVIRVPIDPLGQAGADEAYADRADDGILTHRGADGQRARARLQGVLAFGLLHGDDGGYEVHARVFGNPAAEVPLPLVEFAPIPRLVVVEETETERKMGYLGSNDEPLDEDCLPAWKHSP